MAQINNDTTTELLSFQHPLGDLRVLVDHGKKRIIMVTFVPTQDIKCEETKAIDWYFEGENGKYTGWGIGLKGWKPDE